MSLYDLVNKQLWAAIINISITIGSYAQTDFSHWNQLVGWDGITPWVNYLTISPAYMGPNALPVPLQQKGLVRQHLEWETRGEVYWNKGDLTVNPYTRIYVPLGKGGVAIEGFYVPAEYYQTSAEIRDYRKARDFGGKGWAAGDVYLSTIIQLIKDKKTWPDIAFGINLRTASGTELGNLRYTDAPGYYFDVSLGKTYTSVNRDHLSFRWYGMAGFYVWQMYSTRYFQNDAILYGLGTDLSIHCWKISNQLSGYWGYLNNGDRPLIWNFLIEKKINHFRISATFQEGIKNFPFHAFKLGITYLLNIK